MSSKQESLKLTITDREKARLVKVLLREMGLKETEPGVWEKVSPAKKKKPVRKVPAAKAKKVPAVTTKPVSKQATPPKAKPTPRQVSPAKPATAKTKTPAKPRTSKPATGKNKK